MQKFDGVHLIIESLKEQGAKLVFGYPGGAVIPLYDGLYDAQQVKNILTRHEQGAIHMAQGWAKSTGQVGVVIATSGPGATNLITGIADAMSDSTPLVIITGQVGTGVIGKDAFQEADVLGMTMPITKHNYQVRDAKNIQATIKEAFHIATTGRKGPVLIDMPKNVCLSEALWDENLVSKPVNIPSYQPNLQPSLPQIAKIIDALKNAKKPLLLVGAGAMDAAQELNEFINKLKLPVVSTLLGLGIVPNSYENFLGMGGMHGSFAANMALCECDFLLNIGSRFDDRLASLPSEFATEAVIAHIDIDPAELGKVVRTDIPIVSDAKNALQQILKSDFSGVDSENFHDWRKLVLSKKERHPFKYEDSQTQIKPQKVIEKIGEITKGKAFVVTDVGQHQMWAAQFYPFSFARQLITSGGLGTMGFCIPAAIGVQFANPDSEVVAIVGDGGFQMTNQELILVKEYGLKTKFVLLNNGVLGMVHQWQDYFHNKRFSASEFKAQPDFMKLAEAYGIKGVKLENPATLESDLRSAFALDEAVVIEVVISKDEFVLPMVPSGAPNYKMLGIE